MITHTSCLLSWRENVEILQGIGLRSGVKLLGSRDKWLRIRQRWGDWRVSSPCLHRIFKSLDSRVTWAKLESRSSDPAESKNWPEQKLEADSRCKAHGMETVEKFNKVEKPLCCEFRIGQERLMVAGQPKSSTPITLPQLQTRRSLFSPGRVELRLVRGNWNSR